MKNDNNVIPMHHQDAPPLDDFTAEHLKTPPESEQAEQSVLGGMMLDNSKIPSIAAFLTEKDFYRRDNQLVFRAILELNKKGKSCDLITVSEWLADMRFLDSVGGISYLGILAKNTPSAANIESYADIVKEKSALRMLINIGTYISTSAFSPLEIKRGKDNRVILSAVDIAGKAVEMLADVQALSDKTTQSGAAIADSMKNETFKKAELIARRDDGLPGTTTGLPSLDEVTNGLLPQFYCIAGAKGSGKSQVLYNMAIRRSVQNAGGTKKELSPTLLINLDAPKEEILNRLGSAIAGVDFDKLLKQELTNVEWGMYNEACDRVSSSELTIVNEKRCTTERIKNLTIAWLHKLTEEQRKNAAVFVDSIQKIAPSNPRNSAFQTHSDSSLFFDEISDTDSGLGVPFVVISQLNKEGVTKAARNERYEDLDVKYGSEVAPNCRVMFGVLYDKNSDDDDFNLICLKMNGGKYQDVFLKQRFSKSRIIDPNEIS